MVSLLLVFMLLGKKCCTSFVLTYFYCEPSVNTICYALYFHVLQANEIFALTAYGLNYILNIHARLHVSSGASGVKLAGSLSRFLHCLCEKPRPWLSCSVAPTRLT